MKNTQARSALKEVKNVVYNVTLTPDDLRELKEALKEVIDSIEKMQKDYTSC